MPCAGQAAGECAGSTLTTTFVSGLSSVVCRTPSSGPGCLPAVTPSGSFGTEYSRSSGWTADGRVLHLLGVALGAPPGTLAFPAPCAIACAAAPPPPGGNGTAPGFTNGTGGGAGAGGTNGTWNTNGTNGTWLPPLPKLCFQCRPFEPENFEPFVSDLDLIALAMAAGIPTNNLTFVPEIADFPALVSLMAEGMPLQGTPAVLAAMHCQRYAPCLLLMPSLQTSLQLACMHVPKDKASLQCVQQCSLTATQPAARASVCALCTHRHGALLR